MIRLISSFFTDWVNTLCNMYSLVRQLILNVELKFALNKTIYVDEIMKIVTQCPMHYLLSNEMFCNWFLHLAHCILHSGHCRVSSPVVPRVATLQYFYARLMFYTTEY
jgi:hypothetical protein